MAENVSRRRRGGRRRESREGDTQSVSGVSKGAGGKDDEEWKEDGEYADEGDTLLSALERVVRDSSMGFWMFLISVFLRIFFSVFFLVLKEVNS